jgi:hypothetical protein
MIIHFGLRVDTIFYQSNPSDVDQVQVVDLLNTTSAVVAEIGDGEAVST